MTQVSLYGLLLLAAVTLCCHTLSGKPMAAPKEVNTMYQCGSRTVTHDKQGSSQKMMHFLGINCENRYVAVFEGTSEEPGDWVWRDRIELISTEETFTASLGL